MNRSDVHGSAPVPSHRLRRAGPVSAPVLARASTRTPLCALRIRYRKESRLLRLKSAAGLRGAVAEGLLDPAGTVVTLMTGHELAAPSRLPDGDADVIDGTLDALTELLDRRKRTVEA